ncbi:MAG: 3-deoxy-D-manno-octulosonic acid transferase [Pseudomonadota bacterium]|jgi:3-deoxy-D-manno-octulosonic-acid transferase
MAQASSGLTWLERLALAAYGVVLQLLQPLLRRKLRRRAQQEPEYGLHVAQRFGHHVGDVPQGEWVWLHAVSLGETRAAALLLPALREAFPGMRLLLTHGTATGLVQGRALLQSGDEQAWLPWDTAQATRQFLQHFQPRIGLLMETEVWPGLVQACRHAGVPLCLLNARMSDRSWRQAERWSWLSAPAYRGLSLVLAQSAADAQRLQQLGCQDVRVVGNLKFDVTVSEPAHSLAMRWLGVLATRPVVMLASTREGEEAMWLQALQSQPSRLTQLQALGVLWLLVPRHPQRFDEVHALVEKDGWRCERRSNWGVGAPDALRVAAADVVLGDSLGEMQAYYLVSRMALLGGSFAPLGGQNLIEAAACGCPVVMGPHTFNFSDAAALAAEQGAAVRVQDMQAALDQVVFALAHPPWLAQAQAATVQLLAKGRGAVALHMAALRSIITMDGGEA